MGNRNPNDVLVWRHARSIATMRYPSVCSIMRKDFAIAKEIVFAVAFAMLIAQPAHATTPPLGPPEYSAYGQLQICAGDFKIEIGPNEAVHIIGDVTRLLRDDYIIAVVPTNLSSATIATRDSIPLVMNDGRTAYRFTAPTPDTNRTVIFAPQALKTEDIRYAVTASGDSRVLIVGSTAFTGALSDKEILARVFSRKVTSTDCISPEISRVLSIGPNASRGAKFAREKLAYQAKFYPPNPDRGRDFFCIGGIGFTLTENELLYRPWKSLGEAGEATVRIGDVLIKIRRSSSPLPRMDESNAHDHPLGILNQSRITYFPSRGTGAPYAPPGIREDGSWSIELGKYLGHRIYLNFPASDKTPVGFQFLERLQFVEENDPRCAD